MADRHGQTEVGGSKKYRECNKLQEIRLDRIKEKEGKQNEGKRKSRKRWLKRDPFERLNDSDQRFRTFK